MLAQGTRIGAFEVLKLVGAGRGSMVYRVRNTARGSVHVLKLLDPRLVEKSGSRRRFQVAGRVLKRLRHPNIVSVTDVITEPGIAGLIVDDIDAQPLEERLASQTRAMNSREAREILLPVLEAVGYAHSQNVVHTGLKPSNILLARNAHGRVVPMVLDFGMAQLKVGLPLAKEEATLGTAHYRAPEQVNSSSKSDARTDIFAIGAILYELVVGNPPFAGVTDSEVMQAVAAGRYRAPGLTVEPVIRMCIKRALSGSPGERFANCREFADALGDKRAKAPAVRRGSESEERVRRVMMSFAVVLSLMTLAFYIGNSDVADSSPPPLNDVLDTPDMEPPHDVRTVPAPGPEPIPEPEPEPESEPEPEPEPEPRRKDPRLVVLNNLGFPLRFARIPSGTFLMGSEPGSRAHSSDEAPAHEVRVSSLMISETEVSQEQWEAVMNTEPSFFTGLRLPVENVSWCEAVLFANALSDIEGLTQAYEYADVAGCEQGAVYWNRQANGYRLPTEAEWEYVARARTTTQVWFGDRELDVAQVGWYRANSDNRTHEVARKPANMFGMFDMNGNVREWTWDFFGPYSTGFEQDPTGPESGQYRVVRGGSFQLPSKALRSATRVGHIAPDTRSSSVGFRIAVNTPRVRIDGVSPAVADDDARGDDESTIDGLVP